MLSLSQKFYINKILERFNMQTCNPIDTPIAKGENFKLCPLTPEENKKCPTSHIQVLLAV